MAGIEDQQRRIDAQEKEISQLKDRVGKLEAANNILNTRILRALDAAAERGFIARTPIPEA